MDSLLKILSWIMAQRVSDWQTVLDANVDTALLQEAKAPPDDLKTKFMLDRESDWSEPCLS